MSMTESPIGAVFRGETNPTITKGIEVVNDDPIPTKEKEKKVTEPKKKKTTRVSLTEFPEAVLYYMHGWDPMRRITSTDLIAEMKSSSKEWAKASDSGMQNRLIQMGKDGLLVRHKIGSKAAWSLPVNGLENYLLDRSPGETPIQDPGPEPLVLEAPPARPLMTPKIFADHVEISISDWVILMQGLEATAPGES